MTEPCPFCEIVAGRVHATIKAEMSGVIVFVPLNPVVDGHVLVVPTTHVSDFAEFPGVSAETMFWAAEWARRSDQPMNLITSRGAAATQSVMHLHLHLIPRQENDGLALPWHSGKTSRKGLLL